MKRQAIISGHLADLLAYYPGRGRLALVWLMLVPAGAVLITSQTLGGVGGFSSDAMPYSVFSSAGQSVMWLYIPAVLACLLKINRARTRSVSESAAIVLSSSLYGAVIGVPAAAVAAVWSMYHIGFSLRAVLAIPVGMLITVASVLLVVAFVGLVASRFKTLVPLLLLLAATYRVLVPVTYSLSMESDRWRLLHVFAAPLAPEAVILRDAILNRAGETPGTFWVAALTHSAVGIGVAVWLWSRIAEGEDPDESQATGCS